MKESILVIGASGFLGYQIKTFLETKGNKVFGTYSQNYVKDLFKFSYNEEKSIDQFKSEVLDKIYNQGYYINSVVIASGITNDQSILNSNILDFREVFSINLEYPFFIAKLMIEYYILNQIKGSFIFISSINSKKGFQNKSLYSMSKAGLNILSESIAAEYGEYGITSNIVMPSFYVSDLNKDLKISNKKLMINTKASLIKKLPDISELLEFIRYLIVHGKSISGQNFVIDNRDFQKEGNSLQNSYSAWEKKNNE